MSVRPATAADIERLVDLNMEVHDLHVARLPSFFRPARREDLRRYFDECLASQDAQVFVACDGSVVVGYMLVIIRERPENPVALAQRWLYIEQIGVTEAYRGRGYGAALVEAARAVAREHGLNRIELDTWGFNTEAQGFFRSQGFATRSIKMELKV